MKNRANIFILSSLILFTFLLFACSWPPVGTSINVQVKRTDYRPLLEPSKYAEYRGQTMVFDSIDIEAANTENFYYFSDDKSIGYMLFYSPYQMQPVVSFFWYALQKVFTGIGIDVKEAGPVKNAPQLHLKITYLTDQEAKFLLSLSRNGLLIIQKEVVVSQKLPPTKVVDELEKRSYTFIDCIAETILSDPDFKREFFSEKGKISLDKQIPEIPHVSSAPVSVPVKEMPISSLVPTPPVPAPTKETRPPRPPEPIKKSDDTKARSTEPAQVKVVNDRQNNQLKAESLKQQVQEKKNDTPPSVEKTLQISEHADIKGIVLMNGTIIEGQVISMNPNIVKIRTKDGKISSYSFKDEVYKFIKK